MLTKWSAKKYQPWDFVALYRSVQQSHPRLKFYLYLHNESKKTSRVFVGSYIVEDEKESYLHRLLSSTHRFVDVQGQQLPLISGYDTRFGIAKRYANGDFSQVVLVPHAFSILFDKEGKVISTSPM